MTDLREIILTVPVFLLAISFHEYAHALVAVKLGDPTPRLQGRLTLNFMAHFSLLGALMLLLMGIGWAKPVQVSARNFRNQSMGMLWVSLAGPLANVLLAIGFAVLTRIALPVFYGSGVVGNSIVMLLYMGVQHNILLAVFNLIPIPPLDGSKVIAPFLPARWANGLMSLEQWGFLIIFLLFRYSGLGNLLSSATSAFLHVLL